MSFNATTAHQRLGSERQTASSTPCRSPPTATPVFLGGKFTNVHGTTVNNFAAVDSTAGAVITSIPHSVSGQVESLFRTYNNHTADSVGTSCGAGLEQAVPVQRQPEHRSR
jgi:hypothetical protein